MARRKAMMPRINREIKTAIAVLIMVLSLSSSMVKAEETAKDKLEAYLLVEWERVGGFFGEQSFMKVYQDGSVALTEPRKEAKLAPQEIQDLKDVFEKSNFFSLKDKYMHPSVVKDAMTQWITYAKDGKTKTVVTDFIPLELKNIILKLEEIEKNL